MTRSSDQIPDHVDTEISEIDPNIDLLVPPGLDEAAAASVRKEVTVMCDDLRRFVWKDPVIPDSLGEDNIARALHIEETRTLLGQTGVAHLLQNRLHAGRVSTVVMNLQLLEEYAREAGQRDIAQCLADNLEIIFSAMTDAEGNRKFSREDTEVKLMVTALIDGAIIDLFKALQRPASAADATSSAVA